MSADSKWLSQVKRGVLELAILNIVKQRPVYGYEILKALSTVRGLAVTAGTIYPLMSRLKREGLLTSRLVESPSGPARRVYALSTDGEVYLLEINQAWKSLATGMDQIIARTTNIEEAS